MAKQTKKVRGKQPAVKYWRYLGEEPHHRAQPGHKRSGWIQQPEEHLKKRTIPSVQSKTNENDKFTKTTSINEIKKQGMSVAKLHISPLPHRTLITGYPSIPGAQDGSRPPAEISGLVETIPSSRNSFNPASQPLLDRSRLSTQTQPLSGLQRANQYSSINWLSHPHQQPRRSGNNPNLSNYHRHHERVPLQRVLQLEARRYFATNTNNTSSRRYSILVTTGIQRLRIQNTTTKSLPPTATKRKVIGSRDPPFSAHDELHDIEITRYDLLPPGQLSKTNQSLNPPPISGDEIGSRSKSKFQHPSYQTGPIRIESHEKIIYADQEQKLSNLHLQAKINQHVFQKDKLSFNMHIGLPLPSQADVSSASQISIEYYMTTPCHAQSAVDKIGPVPHLLAPYLIITDGLLQHRPSSLSITPQTPANVTKLIQDAEEHLLAPFPRPTSDYSHPAVIKVLLSVHPAVALAQSRRALLRADVPHAPHNAVPAQRNFPATLCHPQPINTNLAVSVGMEKARLFAQAKAEAAMNQARLQNATSFSSIRVAHPMSIEPAQKIRDHHPLLQITLLLLDIRAQRRRNKSSECRSKIRIKTVLVIVIVIACWTLYRAASNNSDPTIQPDHQFHVISNHLGRSSSSRELDVPAKPLGSACLPVQQTQNRSHDDHRVTHPVSFAETSSQPRSASPPPPPTFTNHDLPRPTSTCQLSTRPLLASGRSRVGNIQGPRSSPSYLEQVVSTPSIRSHNHIGDQATTAYSPNGNDSSTSAHPGTPALEEKNRLRSLWNASNHPIDPPPPPFDQPSAGPSSLIVHPHPSSPSSLSHADYHHRLSLTTPTNIHDHNHHQHHRTLSALTLLVIALSFYWLRSGSSINLNSREESLVACTSIDRRFTALIMMNIEEKQKRHSPSRKQVNRRGSKYFGFQNTKINNDDIDHAFLSHLGSSYSSSSVPPPLHDKSSDGHQTHDPDRRGSSTGSSSGTGSTGPGMEQVRFSRRMSSRSPAHIPHPSTSSLSSIEPTYDLGIINSFPLPGFGPQHTPHDLPHNSSLNLINHLDQIDPQLYLHHHHSPPGFDPSNAPYPLHPCSTLGSSSWTITYLRS
ncbi:hypothetical protein KEM48_004174 [Puccinia striiformis f. sp. tritici PST-130]|nr:hypothetical protein KEM48_004174 [Puccinia striiformis f. sp. tritici PST-130]